jgi:predicted phage-related endonuclease
VAEQSFASHAHHPVPTYVASVFVLVALILSVGAWLFGWATMDIAVVALACAGAVFVTISRTYTTRLQDRIIQLEMKLRCAQLLPPDQAARLGALSPKQVVALRFAADEELGELLDRAVREQLPPTEIKRAIRHWRADNLRT